MSHAGWVLSLLCCAAELAGDLIEEDRPLGKPCHWTVPGSSRPSKGPEPRSPRLERVPGSGGLCWAERASQDPVLTEPRETPPLFSLDTARVRGRPDSAVSCGVSWTQEKLQTSALGASQGRPTWAWQEAQGWGGHQTSLGL